MRALSLLSLECIGDLPISRSSLCSELAEMCGLMTTLTALSYGLSPYQNPRLEEKFLKKELTF